MHLTFRNVNDAFRSLVEIFHMSSPSGKLRWANGQEKRDVPVVKKNSRNGPVMMIEEPVTITYTHPRERVLFNQARDANPFFHLYEALWMLAGRNDVAPLAYYNSKIKEYSDDGKTFNGAYGYRWRKMPYNRPESDELDQLEEVISHLKGDPESRRAVVQMWHPELDLLNVGTKFSKFSHYQDRKGSKDVCCNLSVMFSVREAVNVPGMGPLPTNKRFLDMTVTNRSNDMIWGMLGANYVHFTFLQEYMAANIGVEVGKYHHITNNLHVYESTWEPEKWFPESKVLDRYEYYKQIPLIKEPAVFEKELPEFVERHTDGSDIVSVEWQEPFLDKVAEPMLLAFHDHKARHYDMALVMCKEIKADDWRIAATNWIKKRQLNYERKVSDVVSD